MTSLIYDAQPKSKAAFVLTLTCDQSPGIVQAVTTFLFERQCDIQEHHQFDDAYRNRFFMRTAFISHDDELSVDKLADEFADIADTFGMSFEFHDPAPVRMLIMVSKAEHCLNDLLFRWRAGSLGGEIVAVASNHEDMRQMVEAAGLPYVHIPITPETKHASEHAIRNAFAEYDASLIVLARYMQVLSDEFACDFSGKAINIHHSFLPGFKGGRPYHQAYDRGVKLVGATAHYITTDLDEGPIIEQDVVRVNHSFDPADMATIGRDVESAVLSRAVRWHCEHRVLLDGQHTIVFV